VQIQQCRGTIGIVSTVRTTNVLRLQRGRHMAVVTTASRPSSHGTLSVRRRGRLWGKLASCAICVLNIVSKGLREPGVRHS